MPTAVRLKASLGTSSADEQARMAAWDLTIYRTLGVAFVILEVGDGCPACARLAGRIYAIDNAPAVPVHACTGVCCCRLAPFGLE